MDGGFPIARLAAALALSLTAHLLAAWGLGGLLGPQGDAAGRGMAAFPVQARLVADAPPARAPIPSRQPARAGRSAGSSRLAAPPHYVPAAELDARPQIMTHVMPEYPADLVAGIRGRVVLELSIARDGTLDRIRVTRAEPAGFFEQAAVKAFQGARFTPGMKSGNAVASLVLIEISFGE